MLNSKISSVSPILLFITVLLFHQRSDFRSHSRKQRLKSRKTVVFSVKSQIWTRHPAFAFVLINANNAKEQNPQIALRPLRGGSFARGLARPRTGDRAERNVSTAADPGGRCTGGSEWKPDRKKKLENADETGRRNGKEWFNSRGSSPGRGKNGIFGIRNFGRQITVFVTEERNM